MDVSQFEFNGTFNEQVRMLLSIVRLTKSEVEHLVKLFNDVEHALRKVWPNCNIMPFGSVISGLGIKTSDVDIYAHVPKHLYDCEKTCVNKARKILRLKTNFSQILAIPKAKVPIIKFYHTPTGRNCDINFKSPAGVRNSNLIAFLLHMDPRALPLTVLIKYWSKVHSLTGTNLMPSYCLIMMVIFYLQQKGILPSVYSLQDDIEEFIVDGWNTGFNCNYQHETTNSESLYKLLGEFFVYYSNFNYANVISPFAGFILTKQSFCNKQAHDIFYLYKEYVNRDNSSELRTDTNICVQDPFEHNRNCAVAVFPRLANTVLSYFKNAAQIYSNKQETEFLKSLLTETPGNPSTGACTGAPLNRKNKKQQLNKMVPQFKNKVMKQRPNYYHSRRDIIHKVYNSGHFPLHNNFHNR